MFLRFLLFFTFLTFKIFASDCEKPKMPSDDEWDKWLNKIKIEAIDIGRRSIHDEGAEILREIVKAEIEISIDTSRRLFTLISILSVKI